MHDCALGREEGPSAPRVEHRCYAGDGIMVKSGGREVKKCKKKSFFLFLSENSKNQVQQDYRLLYF